MPYTPVATNVTQPADTGVQASTAAAEFRALKLYIATSIVPALAVGAPLNSPAFTGNVTMASPVSGVGLTQSGVAGFNVVNHNGGASGVFSISDRGLPYGDSIHNNPGPVTGTTTQYITSGTYTPTITAVTNVSSITPRPAQWIRVGNVVSVSCQAVVTPTANSTNTKIAISLPIASGINSEWEVVGAGCRYNNGVGATLASAVFGDAAGNRAFAEWFQDTTAGGITHCFTFTYMIL